MPKSIPGVGKDAPTTTNANGGRQSASPYRSDLFPPRAFLAVAEVLAKGAKKYGDNNWHRIEVNEHLNHCLNHIFAHLAGDGTDDHLGHAACRAMMALEIQLRGGADRPADKPADWPPGFTPPWPAWTYNGDGCGCPDCGDYRKCIRKAK